MAGSEPPVHIARILKAWWKEGRHEKSESKMRRMFCAGNPCGASDKCLSDKSRGSLGMLEFIILLNLNRVCGEVGARALVSWPTPQHLLLNRALLFVLVPRNLQ